MGCREKRDNRSVWLLERTVRRLRCDGEGWRQHPIESCKQPAEPQNASLPCFFIVSAMCELGRGICEQTITPSSLIARIMRHISPLKRHEVSTSRMELVSEQNILAFHWSSFLFSVNLHITCLRTARPLYEQGCKKMSRGSENPVFPVSPLLFNLFALIVNLESFLITYMHDTSQWSRVILVHSDRLRGKRWGLPANVRMQPPAKCSSFVISISVQSENNA